MRLWKAFKTKEDQTEFEKSQASEHDDFRVCMHMTAKQLEEDMCMEKGRLSEYEFVTVYTFD